MIPFRHFYPQYWWTISRSDFWPGSQRRWHEVILLQDGSTPGFGALYINRQRYLLTRVNGTASFDAPPANGTLSEAAPAFWINSLGGLVDVVFGGFPDVALQPGSLIAAGGFAIYDVQAEGSCFSSATSSIAAVSLSVFSFCCAPATVDATESQFVKHFATRRRYQLLLMLRPCLTCCCFQTQIGAVLQRPDSTP